MYTQIIRDDFNDNIIDITFMITNRCNYSCSYCIENLQNLHSDNYIFLDLIKTTFFINEYIESYPNKKINIRIYGGEPTLHPDLLDFCEKLNNINNILIIEIFTNFSLPYEVYNKLLIIQKVHLFTSYHTNSIMSDNHYLHKILKFNKLYYNKIVCNIMLENETIEHTKNTYNLYKQMIKIWKNSNYKKIRTELIPLFSTTKYISNYKKYTYKILETINNLNNEKISFSLIDKNNDKQIVYKVVGYNSLNFKNWLCSSGENAIFIDPFGDIYPCGGLYTKRNYIYTNKIKQNIFKYKNIHTLFKKTICPHDDCVLCVPMKVININNLDTINLINNKFNILNN